MGISMLRVYLRRLEASRPLSPPWPVYVAEATGCHQEDWDPEVSGVRCRVCDRRLDTPPPAAGPSCSPEPVPLIELPDDDDEVEEIKFCIVIFPTIRLYCGGAARVFVSRVFVLCVYVFVFFRYPRAVTLRASSLSSLALSSTALSSFRAGVFSRAIDFSLYHTSLSRLRLVTVLPPPLCSVRLFSVSPRRLLLSP
ncbi:unnamed protein product [Trichogramma brassicae]|uniref:Uncharacterized protein n=1 Tax=Trichogramma brassicae TaxID=86971 RepID=A0A6H5J3W7_9HYME|nr:unnamed protein product [Trichogramma brassicae]